MSNFKSITHARKCMTLAKNRINQILSVDLPSLSDEERSLDLWYKKFEDQPGFSDKVDEMKRLEKNRVDAEIYIICTRSTKVDKEALMSR